MAKTIKDKPSFAELKGTMEKPSTPVQSVVPVDLIQQVQYAKKLDDLSKEVAVNITTSLPLSLRDKLRDKASTEKKAVKDLIIEALLYKFEDLR